jgi:hypothetical protein
MGKVSVMATTKTVQVACYLTPEQHEGLKRLSAEALVPMQIYLRYAVDRLLQDHHIVPRRVPDEMLDARIAGRKRGARR